jgi:predicted transcriptional regulator of viral defense system
MKTDFREAIFKSSRTVFRLRDIAMLTGMQDADNLKSAVSYYAEKGVLRNVRRGVYVKEEYSAEELACRIYSPAYISLETVLARAGIVFQYTPVITAVSYLSRNIEVDGQEISYQKIRDSALVESKGVIREGNVNVALPERAFLDRLYLSKNYFFDNLDPLNREVVEDLLYVYRCRALENRARRMLKDA